MRLRKRVSMLEDFQKVYSKETEELLCEVRRLRHERDTHLCIPGKESWKERSDYAHTNALYKAFLNRFEALLRHLKLSVTIEPSRIVVKKLKGDKKGGE